MKRDGREGAVNLLRICTICLAAVSFWATAKGMTKYVFSEKWQAYAASLAIQGILLGMNFYMPIFLKDLDKVWKRFILGFLTAIVILCSSWFSYLYIVDKVYEDSWNTERYLLTEEVYRQTLYEGNAYAEEYKMMLGEQLPETITDIYDLARTIRTSSNEETKESSENSQEFNWEKEREDYCKDNFDGKELMSEAIDGMEQAMQDKEDVGTRNATVKSLENIQENFKIKIDELTEESIEADENVKKAQKTLDDMKKNGDSEGISYANSELERAIKEKTNIANQLEYYREAKQRIGDYLTRLENMDGDTYNSIVSELLAIQKGLFTDNFDIDELIERAATVFENLQNANPGTSKEDENFAALLQKMNRFSVELKNYKKINESCQKFENMIDELSGEQMVDALNNDEWEKNWREKINDLKAVISAMPDYHEGGNQSLARYDKSRVAQDLSQIIRKYLTTHNAAQQGIIYLLSPYFELALFSLILALFFDLSGFITGILIYDMEERDQSKVAENNISEYVRKTDNKELYSKMQGKNSYVYFTGNYLCSDGVYTYQAFREGKEVEIVSEKSNVLDSGLYLEKDDDYFPVMTPQALSYAKMSGGISDGIYTDGFLTYEDSVLTIAEEEKGDYQYLTIVEQEVPVYQLYSDHLSVYPVTLLQNQGAHLIVVALNKEGTRVIAIYLIERLVE